MEQHALRQRIQQPSETFDDYLVALQELAKTCNFCSDECAQKNIRDQIIEGINDGDTVEHLLRQPNLTLDTAINTCRAQKAAKRQRREITEQSPGVILSIKQPQHKTKQPTRSNAPTQPSHTCPGCGARAHQGGRKACPAYNQLCHYCHKIGHYARVCQARLSQQTNPQAAEQEMRSPKMSTIRQVTAAEPAPTILIHISTNKRFYQIPGLPDSGADISAAGQDLEYLNEHTDHLVRGVARITQKGF